MSEHSDNVGQAIREAAWQQALTLNAQWHDACRAASGGSGGAGYRDPLAAAEAKRLRTLLDELVTTHQFQGTRVDPMLPWTAQQSASWQCPPANAEIA